MTNIETHIELLAQKALRRISREGQFASKSALVSIHARAVRAAQNHLEATTSSSVAHCRLHTRINEMMGVA